MGILTCVLPIFGCTQKPVKPDSELTSISISQSHMDRTYCYHFWARLENNSYLLDAECLIVDYENNDYREINFTDAEITEKEFKRFAEIDKEYGSIINQKYFNLLEKQKCFLNK